MKRWIARAIIIFLIVLILYVCVYMISLGLELPQIKVWSKIIIFIGEGLGTVIFTPYLLLLILVFLFLINHEKALELARKLSVVFEEVGGVKFRPSDPEQPISTEKIPETIQNSRNVGRPKRSDTNFFKELFTRNGSMVICRFLVYAIDRPARPSNFTLKQLAEWTFGTTAANMLEKQGDMHILIYPASLLIQTGALEGRFNLSGNQVSFESTRVNPAAHQAIEELSREGFQMTPQVDIN